MPAKFSFTGVKWFFINNMADDAKSLKDDSGQSENTVDG